jgi:SAM-dependent methyltransferase
MTTDPGDLVLDPTCGSGTTAYVAEQWGRRWITCDTSRVALSLARQRLMTATFPFYELAYPKEGVAGGFKYKTVPHVTLKSIAQNLAPEIEQLYDQPVEHKHITRVAGTLLRRGHRGARSGRGHDPGARGAPTSPLRPADRVQQLFDVLARDGGLSVARQGPHRARGPAPAHGPGRASTPRRPSPSTTTKLRLAVAFGPYHGPVTANRLEDAVTAAEGGGLPRPGGRGVQLRPRGVGLPRQAPHARACGSSGCRSPPTCRSATCSR